MVSSPPDSETEATPAGSPPLPGFGPHTAPQSPMTHFSVSADADHCPSSGVSAAVERAVSPTRTDTITAERSEVRDNVTDLLLSKILAVREDFLRVGRSASEASEGRGG